MRIKILPLFLLLASLVCFIVVGYWMWQRYDPGNLDFANLPPVATNSAALIPRLLTIPQLEIRLPVIPQSITNGRLPLTSAGVTYLLSSPSPGTPGNSILYGHNWPILLRNLKQAKVGQRLTISYTNGSARDFVIREIKTVSTSEVSVLGPTTFPQLTLYTCTGFLDRQRLVVIALPL